MAIITRAVKGSPLTTAELDNNFIETGINQAAANTAIAANASDITANQAAANTAIQAATFKGTKVIQLGIARVEITELRVTHTTGTEFIITLSMSMARGSDGQIVGAYVSLSTHGSTLLASPTNAGNRFAADVYELRNTMQTHSNTYKFSDPTLTTGSPRVFRVFILQNSASTQNCYINRGATDTDNINSQRGISSLIVQRIGV